jgi:hypothetical protein
MSGVFSLLGLLREGIAPEATMLARIRKRGFWSSAELYSSPSSWAAVPDTLILYVRQFVRQMCDRMQWPAGQMRGRKVTVLPYLGYVSVERKKRRRGQKSVLESCCSLGRGRKVLIARDLASGHTVRWVGGVLRVSTARFRVQCKTSRQTRPCQRILSLA